MTREFDSVLVTILMPAADKSLWENSLPDKPANGWLYAVDYVDRQTIRDEPEVIGRGIGMAFSRRLKKDAEAA